MALAWAARSASRRSGSLAASASDSSMWPRYSHEWSGFKGLAGGREEGGARQLWPKAPLQGVKVNVFNGPAVSLAPGMVLAAAALGLAAVPPIGDPRQPLGPGGGIPAGAFASCWYSGGAPGF